MEQLCILVEEPLSFTKLDNSSESVIIVRGNEYKKRQDPDEGIVFYDWIVDENGLARALEIHLAPDHPLLESNFPLNRIALVETDCFVRV